MSIFCLKKFITNVKYEAKQCSPFQDRFSSLLFRSLVCDKFSILMHSM